MQFLSKISKILVQMSFIPQQIQYLQNANVTVNGDVNRNQSCAHFPTFLQRIMETTIAAICEETNQVQYCMKQFYFHRLYSSKNISESVFILFFEGSSLLVLQNCQFYVFILVCLADFGSNIEMFPYTSHIRRVFGTKSGEFY